METIYLVSVACAFVLPKIAKCTSIIMQLVTQVNF